MMLQKLRFFRRCREDCATGQWGPNCANKCTCQNRDNDCDAVTGRCAEHDDDASSLGRTSSNDYLRSSTTQPVQTSRISNADRTEVTSVSRETTDHQTEGAKEYALRRRRDCLRGRCKSDGCSNVKDRILWSLRKICQATGANVPRVSLSFSVAKKII